MYTRTRLDEAVTWLRAYLAAHGPTDSRTLKTAASTAGFTDERLLFRARLRAKVWSVKTIANATVWQLDEPTH